MRKVVHVFVGVMLAAGVVGAQGLPYWCEETPCIRVLAPEEGDTVNPESTFLVEVILTPELVQEGAHCPVGVYIYGGETPATGVVLFLEQHQRPRGESPVSYRIWMYDVVYADVMDASKPVGDEGDYLPHRFRILGELHLEPDDSLLFSYSASGWGCGNAYADLSFPFYTSSP